MSLENSSCRLLVLTFILSISFEVEFLGIVFHQGFKIEVLLETCRLRTFFGLILVLVLLPL